MVAESVFEGTCLLGDSSATMSTGKGQGVVRLSISGRSVTIFSTPCLSFWLRAASELSELVGLVDMVAEPLLDGTRLRAASELKLLLFCFFPKRHLELGTLVDVRGEHEGEAPAVRSFEFAVELGTLVDDRGEQEGEAPAVRSFEFALVAECCSWAICLQTASAMV